MCLVGNKRAEIARVVPCENNFCTKYAHHLHFCGLQKLNTLNLRHFHPPLNLCNHFSTVLIKTNWYTISCKYSGCSGLTSVIIGENVTDIRSGAFADCSSLTSVIFNAENCADFSFPESPFKSGNLTTLIIGEGVKHIPSYFAYNQKSITDITIPNSVTSIGSSAFLGCSGLKAVNISDIAAWCGISFSNEESNPFYISKHLYVNGSEIHDLLIPKSVSSIGDFAFYSCSSLKSIHIQGRVSSIGTKAFYGCDGLTKVNISDVAAWCNISFSSLNDNPISYTQHLFVNDLEIKDLIIPSTVTSIGDNVFARCSELKSVTIPNSVVSIGKEAFYYSLIPQHYNLTLFISS